MVMWSWEISPPNAKRDPEDHSLPAYTASGVAINSFMPLDQVAQFFHKTDVAWRSLWTHRNRLILAEDGSETARENKAWRLSMLDVLACVAHGVHDKYYRA